MTVSLSSIQRDVLREIGNIGAGNAATSMSQLINKRIDMDMPSVNVVSFDEMMDMIGGPDEPVVAMFFRIYGKAPGTVYFILSIEEAESLIDQMTNGMKVNLLDTNEQNSIGVSALKEVGNIITGSYLSALSDFININMQSSIPYLSIDMAGAILTVGLFEISQMSDYAIVINTEINDENKGNGLHGHFFLLPDMESLPKIFSALGIEDYD